ncbi:3'-5' exonuclease [Micromonospora sp. NPDC051925]|uniref:3'-5' exonuclease n=1 Tax=Micromonospora sp. NPDC051925 TaxID=3364288 RepID=UPI0037CBA115
MKQYRDIGDPLDGADVVLVGLFSARERRYEARLDQFAALVEARGGRVVARYVQRRGASDRWKVHPGGATRMSRPFSRRTLLTHGKVLEVAEACRKADIDAAIFVNTLTHVQRTVLADILGCLVISGDDLAANGGTGHRPLKGVTASRFIPRRRGAGRQRSQRYDTQQTEVAALAKQVGEWLAQGVQPGEIAICTRFNLLLDAVYDELTGVGIPAVRVRDQPGADVDGVRLATMHAMKGLEFRCVAVVGVTAKAVPFTKEITPSEVDQAQHDSDLLRERCLLFVAATRAREALYVSWSGAPSPFLPSTR